MTDKPRSSGAGTLAACLGGAALAGLCMSSLDRLEGNELVGYRDIVGVVTACQGVTGKQAVLGRVYSLAQCAAMNEASAIEHAVAVKRCTPALSGAQLVAATLLTYNIGATAYCASTVARRFNAKDLRGGCEAFAAWNKAGGRVVPGLVNRRAYERGVCLRDLPPA